MLLLPIVDRELRRAARSGRTYWMRVTAGAFALAMSLYLIWLVRYAFSGVTAGIFILKFTSYLAFGLCIFTGADRTSDSLSSEKRADTLGLLFLTHLKGYDIVLGKLLANSLSAFFVLLGILPILGIPVLLGGVSGSEMIRIPIALLNSLFFALSIGLLVSSIVRGRRAASALGGGAIVFVAVILPVLAQVVEREWQWPELAMILRIPSPLYAQEMSFSPALGLSTNHFWKAILVQFLIGLFALIGACLILPHSWKTAGNKAFRWREKFDHWVHGSAVSRTYRRTKLLSKNPFFWLSCRDRFAPFWPMLFALILLGVTSWCITHYEVAKEPACGLLFGALAINDLATRVRVASIAATRLAEDRQSGALEMILSTPITVRDVVKGQWMAIRHTYLWTYIPMLLLYAFIAFLFLHEIDSPSNSWTVVLFFVLVSVGDLIVLGTVAMWKGMRVSNPRHAPGAALIRVLIIPWFLWLGLMPLIQQIEPARRWFNAEQPYSYLLAGLLVWSLSSASAFRAARRNLRLHFREAATDRYLFEKKISLLARFRRTREHFAGLNLLRGRRPSALN